MNILLWGLQVILSLWNIIGGLFILENFEKVATQQALSTLHGPVWIALGILQILLALGLILPGAKLRRLNSIAAVGMSALSLLGIALYTQYHGFPGILWGIVPAILAAFIAYERWPNLPRPKRQVN